jgi:serine/threonine-protein kinase
MALTPDEIAAAFPEFTFDPELLGLGGNKVAHRVEVADKDYALKIVKQPISEPDAALPERILREMDGMRKVDSPRVVRIERGPELREIGGETYVWYLEPYYSGGTLKDLLPGPLASSNVVRIVDGLLEGVEALWTQGRLVHRDIKPGNIAFDDQNDIVLLDLGIALHDELTSLTQPFELSPRTTMYAAPEQLEPRNDKERPDFRTDLFLVGMVGFEALTGHHPFDPTRPEDYYDRVRRCEYDRGALDAIENEEELKQFIVRLLSPRPNQRFRTLARARLAFQEATQ